ncbi:MAG: MBL fold metallo-hydrolase [Candidatus Peribacteria bacterium]|jgi:ribonuclease BN (tRNA processing enzyme)|nr:MBL fold metallo-hydrolase [Candidatus Peribacteria bacterium]
MELKFLGRGSAFNLREGNTAAFLKSENGATLFLIDCGEMIFARLCEKNLLVGVKSLHIVLTHLHPDHAGSLASLIFYAYFCLKIIPKVYFPDDILHTFLGLQGVVAFSSPKDGIFTSQYELNALGVARIGELGIHLRFIPVHHTGTLKSTFALALQIGSKKVYYSGDTSNVAGVMGAQGDQYDCIYHECTVLEDSPVHTPYNMLKETFSPEKRSKVYLMHLDTNFDMTVAREDGFSVVSLI